MNIMHSQCVANALNDLFFFLKIVYLSVAMIVRNFVAITFPRLQEKPVRLSTQHHCKVKSYAICKSKFPLKISIAFQATPGWITFLNWTIYIVDALNIREGNKILRSLNVYFCAIHIQEGSCFFNPLHVILSSTSELADRLSHLSQHCKVSL